MRFAALALLTLAACSTTTPDASRSATTSHAASAPRASASVASTSVASPAAAASYAVVETNFLEGGATYTVSLVATDGHVAASATPRKRSHFVQIGNLSTSLTTLYYLDGDTDVHYLRPDGSTGLATTVTLAANQAVAFAVSPDDKRIAVSILDFTRYPVGTRLYVDDLAGHTNHIELFSSPTVEEWPAGWNGGRLVMAMGFNAPPQNAYEGFTRGNGYHVADAQTGARLLSLCDGGSAYGPESPAGFVCVNYPKATVFSWGGQGHSAPIDGACPIYGPLSPAGVMASNFISVSGGCSGSQTVFLIAQSGQKTGQTWDVAGAPAGWIDVTHFVAVGQPPAAGPDTDTSVWIVDIGSSRVIQAQATGFFAAALPGGL